MSPIADLQLPGTELPSGMTTEDARALCSQALDITHSELGIDKLDPMDHEVRIGQRNPETANEGSVLEIALTGGPGTYEEGVDFRPGTTEIELAGTQIQELCTKSGIPGLTTVIKVWYETAWKPRNPYAPPPVPKLSEEEMAKYGSIIRDLKIRLFLSPEALVHVSGASTPESTSTRHNEAEPYSSVTKEVAERFSKILGLSVEDMETEVIITLDADADFSLEVDCQTQETPIPTELRDYLADVAEEILNDNLLTQEGEAEVWFRQGEPQEKRFE